MGKREFDKTMKYISLKDLVYSSPSLDNVVIHSDRAKDSKRGGQR